MYAGMEWTSQFHAVQLPYIADEGKYTIQPAKANVTGALNSSISAIKNRKCPSHLNCLLVKSWNYRSVIHLVGDIHCPVHATNMYSKKHPTGDRNGKDFPITYRDTIPNMHKLWDSILGMTVTLYSSKEIITKNATDIREKYPKANFENQLKIHNVALWAEESYEYGKKYVYDGITEGSKPTQTYISQGREKALERIALAGYRLAQLFDESVNYVTSADDL